MSHIYGVIGFDLAYSQDKLVYQFFDPDGKPLCDVGQHTLSTKLAFDIHTQELGFVQRTQILEKPYLVGYDKLAEHHGELFLGTDMFSERVVKSRVAAGLFEVCVREGISVESIKWFFRTGVPLEYKMFSGEIIGYLTKSMVTRQFNSTTEIVHEFETISCTDQPSFAAQDLFYERTKTGQKLRSGITYDMTVCAVDCGSQVVNFTSFGPPNLSINRPPNSAKIGTWSMLSNKIRPLICMQERIDFFDDYDVICALRTGKIGHVNLSKSTLAELHTQVFEQNFNNIQAGISRVSDPRLLDLLIFYGGSAHEYVNIAQNAYASVKLPVKLAEHPVFTNAEGMFTVALHHFRKYVV